jgi:hypothetical protein
MMCDLILKNIRIPCVDTSRLLSLGIKAGKIALIGPESSFNDKIQSKIMRDYAGSSLELWPSFVETHAHLALCPSLDPHPLPTYITALQYLYSGVTHIVDMFGFPNISKEWEKSEKTSNWEFPKVVHSGYAITSSEKKGRKGHGEEFPCKVHRLQNNSEVARVVESNLRTGATFLKVMFTDGKEVPGDKKRFSKLTLKNLERILTLAQKTRLETVIDCNSFEETYAAYHLGYRYFAHMVRDRRLSEMEFDSLKNATFISTLSGLSPMVMKDSDFCELFDRPPFHVSQDKRDFEDMIGIRSPYGLKIDIQKSRLKSLKNIRTNSLLALQKNALLVGSDSGNTFSFHGYGVHSEFLYLSPTSESQTRSLMHSATMNGHSFFKRLSGGSSTFIFGTGAGATFNLFDGSLSCSNSFPIQTYINGREISRSGIRNEIQSFYNKTQQRRVR